MILRIDVLMFLFIMSNNVWKVYGVVRDNVESCPDCQLKQVASTQPSNRSTTATHSTTELLNPRVSSLSPLQGIPTVPVILVTGSPFSQHSTALVTTSTPPAPTAKQTQSLSPEAKIGIGVGVGILASALGFMAIFCVCYLRRKRREKAVLNAIEEVERATDKGSEERIVLESSVSIIFEDDELEEEEDRGRPGMSLPRREF